MKVPTEADLQELENVVLVPWQVASRTNDEFGKFDRVVLTLEYLIARARYHNTRQSQRNGKPESVPSVQPKQIARSKR
jgi:hypothetical protein